MMVSPVNASSAHHPGSSSSRPQHLLSSNGAASHPQQPTSMSPRRQQSSANRSLPCSILSVLSHLSIALVAFNLGYLYHHTTSGHDESLMLSPHAMLETSASTARSVQSIDTQGSRNGPLGLFSSKVGAASTIRSNLQDSLPIDTVGLFLNGMARVKRDAFTQLLNLGVPLDKTTSSNQDVLVLYSNKAALPTAKPWKNESTTSTVPLYSASDATAHCHTVRLILQQPKKDKECLAILGQWESYTVDKYMRLPEKGNKGASDEEALRLVPRGQKNNGKVAKLPTAKQVTNYWDVLTKYLASLDDTIARLKPIAAKAAGVGGNTVIVMTSNWGQASLLANFVCAARSRHLDISHVLLFATDIETHDLAVSLGIHSFFVDQAFGEMPKVAARVYGDKHFASMMMSKVYCVHLINLLGYDLLFQDLDIYWYRNPLDFFHSDAAGDFDMYFQDDGARSARYAPFSPNSGFYFVRNNPRTQYFFSVFLRMGDLILASGSHQGVLTSVLVEHANWRGLKVKVFGVHQEEGGLFPGGYHFHRNHAYMKQMLQGDGSVNPFIFHMSWTKNKDNKLKFMQQLGHWHLNEQCNGKRADEIGGGVDDVFSHCCSSEPLVACHYRDKPSKIPCRDKPPIDNGRSSFW
ncbi:hypothetical protein MPSEU_000035300 [Mayamaea pseudoterrestris]|nr:hypothetical protein MPSEU_000035300 [Mayamaea pseudoterrestris]